MFQELLSDKWDLVDPAIKKHYGIKEGEKSTIKGMLAVKHGWFFKLLMPFIRLTGALVPVEGDDFIVTVENKVIDNLFTGIDGLPKIIKRMSLSRKCNCIRAM